MLRADELGWPTYMTYDPAGRSQTTRTSAGLQTYMTYDLVGNLTAQSLEQGWGWQPWGSSPWGGERATTYHGYDALNRRTTSTDAYGGVSTAVYDRNGNVDRAINARGFATYHTYDALDRRTHTKDGVHFASTYLGYDPASNVVRSVDQQGATTYMTYDVLNRVVFQHDPAGLLSYYVFDTLGNQTAQHELLGAGGQRRSTYHQYDRVNRQIRQIAADGGQTYFEYDLAGNRVRQVDPVGRTTYLQFDQLNRAWRVSNVFNEKTVSTFDARSSVVTRSDPEGRTAYMGYDGGRRLLHQSNALGEFTYFFHDGRGQQTHVVNPRGYSTYHRYDLLGHQTHRIDALGGVSYMGYDQVGNQVLALDERSNPTYHTYDGLNRSTHVKDALGGVTYMGHDSRSSTVLRVDADGRAAYLAYDTARRLERTWFANPVAGETADAPIYYAYDQAGNLLRSNDSLGGLGFSYFLYDKMDRVTEKETVTGPVGYAYDLSGMKLSVKDPNGEFSFYNYDAAGRMDRAAVLDSSRRENYFYYDEAGLLERKVLYGNQVVSYYAYDLAGRLSNLVNRGDTGAVVTSFVYQRNENGAVTRVEHEDGEYTYYTYDALDRLTEERRVQNPTVYGFSYQYDATSNRTQKVDLVSSATTNYTPNALNLIESETTGPDETVYEYDQAQRMKTRYSADLATYFRHNQRDLPTKVEFASTGTPDPTHEFLYTGTGERAVMISSSFGATLLAYDGSRLLLERFPGGSPLGKYRWAGGVPIETYDGELAATGTPVLDERASVERQAGITGQVIYDRFGVELANDLAGTTRARFVSPAFVRLSTSELRLSLTPRGLYLADVGCLALGPGTLLRQILGGGGLTIGSAPTPGETRRRRGFGWHNQVSIADRSGQAPTVYAQDRPEGTGRIRTTGEAGELTGTTVRDDPDGSALRLGYETEVTDDTIGVRLLADFTEYTSILEGLGCKSLQIVQVIRQNFTTPKWQITAEPKRDPRNADLYQFVDPPRGYPNHDDLPFYDPAGEEAVDDTGTLPSGRAGTFILIDDSPYVGKDLHEELGTLFHEFVSCVVCSYYPPRKAFRVLDCVRWGFLSRANGDVERWGPFHAGKAEPRERGELEGVFDRIVLRDFPGWTIER